VHHCGYWTFERILSNFQSFYDIDLDTVEIEHSDTGRDALADRELAARFIEFHNARAELLVVSRAAHDELHRH